MIAQDGYLSVIDSLDNDAESTIAFTGCGLDYLDQRRSDFMRES